MARIKLKVEQNEYDRKRENGSILNYTYRIMPISYLCEKLQSVCRITNIEQASWDYQYKFTLKRKGRKQDFINQVLNVFSNENTSKYFKIISLE